MVKGQRALLPPEDEERLKQLADTGSAALKQRAQAILAWHEGATANDAARRARLSVNQVQYLWRQYRRKGLDLFMIDTESLSPGPVESTAPESEVEPGRMTLEALCAQYNVNLAHARHVGALAMQIFDATMDVHRLPQNDRTLLEAAALVHNVAYDIDPPNHHLRGRDILMATPLRGLSDDERRILACTTSFHRKKVRPEAEPVYNELPAELRRDALALSAILRVADGLDNSQTQSTQIAEVQVTAEDVAIVVEGPHAQIDAEQAQKKADLWNQIFSARVRVGKAEPAPLASAAPLIPVVNPAQAAPQLNGMMSVERVVRSFALHTLERAETLLRHVQRGEWSVLPSLSREASRLAEAVTLADAKELRKEARWFAATVEEARVCAALAERAASFGDEQGDMPRAYHDRVAGWQAEAKSAVQGIDVPRFEKLAASLRSALMNAASSQDKARIAFHVGALLWEQLAALRDVMEHGNDVGEALAAVRRLQDYLMAFRDLLGPEAAQPIDMLSPLEGYLVAIQTTQVILPRLEPKPVKKGRKTVTPTLDPTTEALRAAQMGILEALADDLPAIWGSVNSPTFRRAFALAIAAP